MTDDECRLLPCPFCGGKASAFQFGTADAYVVCSQCNGRNGVLYPDKQAAITAWNTRTASEGVDIALGAQAIQNYCASDKCDKEFLPFIGCDDSLRASEIINSIAQAIMAAWGLKPEKDK